MSGQIWAVPEEGGYLYSGELSDTLRQDLTPITKFRQLCDAKDGTEKGLNEGDKFQWNVYSKVKRQGRRLSEQEKMPETNFSLAQKELEIYEAGNSVPYTGKLQNLGKQGVEEIIDETLKIDARNYFDIEAFLQFDNTPLRAGPAGGTSTDSIVLEENGSMSVTNDVALGTGHVKAIVDGMKERNIPAFSYDDYACISNVTTLRPFKNQLEAIHQYTEQGVSHIYNGEVGRYESCRFMEQNHIAKGGAQDSQTYDVWDSVADEWDNGKSSWAFFFGADTVTEAIVIPEEIRAKIPGDYGRSKGIAWYYLGGFGLVHDDAHNARIVKWDSAQ